MKTSTDWLKDFITLKSPVAQHAIALTEAGLEVEAVEKTTLGDTVFQTEVTTNRPDWLSHYGVARELSAIHGLALSKLKIADENKMSRTPPAGWRVTTKDTEACPYYTGVLIEGITERKIPEFIQKRLEACGVRSIDLIVDITNYVMLEVGQPLHAFDADILADKQIVVRRARKDEKLIMLAGNEIKLHEQDLVIAGSEKVLALAGVMGGRDSGVTAQTRNIFLESAHFHPRFVRDAARRHQLATDSSYRFERRVDPCLADLARQRAIQLFLEHAKPKSISGVTHCGQKPNPVMAKLHISEEYVQSVIGCDVKANQIASILNRLGLEVHAVSSKAWKVTVPSFRADLTRPIDLVEEIARLYGFDNIPEKLPALAPGSISMRPERRIQKQLREMLKGTGFHETVTFSLISNQGFSEEQSKTMIRLQNPLQAGLEWMRPTLLPSFLPAVQKNLRHSAESIALFEIANVYQQNDKGKDIRESRKLGIVLTGMVHSGSWQDKSREASYFDLKGLLQNILKQCGFNSLEWKKDSFAGLNRSVCEKIESGDIFLGFAGQVAPEWMKIWDLKAPVFYAELDIATLATSASQRKMYQEIARFPSMERDLSMTVPEQVYYGQVADDIHQAGGALVTQVGLIDLFQGGRVAKGFKNLTFRLTYSSPERTLTSEEIDQLHAEIARGLATKYQAQFQAR